MGGHPSPLGTYVIAAVFAGSIHGKSPGGAKFAPPEINDDERDYALALAECAVFGPQR